VGVRLLLFARAREAAGCSADSFSGADARTLGALLAAAETRYGADFAAVLASSRVWVDGEPPESGPATELADGTEVAVLPPVSGGSCPPPPVTLLR
jgi:molybdopterin synthase sulfur carrier subunit